MPVTISSTIQHTPQGQFSAIATKILSTSYDLSIVFVGKTRALKLNQETRGKTYIPNVLSFPLTSHSGEIYICPEVATKEASSFNLSPQGYLEYLCIHGCLHLTGLDHGSVMSERETKLRKHFSITERV